MLDQGRWREAEEIAFQLTLQLASQNANQNDQVAALKLLDRYYRMQARFDDSPKILMQIAEISDNPLPVLREFWRTSRGTIPVELIEKTIAISQTLSPDDSRLWLAKANLAIQKNDFQAASLALAECEKPGQNPDLAVSRSRFRLAFLLNQSDSLIQAAKNLNISDKISPGEIVRLADEISTFFDLQDYKKPTFEVWESLEPANPVFLARYAEFISQMSRPDLIRTINERKSLSDKSQEHWQKLILGPSEPSTKTAILEWINAAQNAGELRVARVLVGHGLRKFGQDQDLNIISSELNTKIQSVEGKLPACRELLAKVLQAADEKVASPAYKSQVNTNPETPFFEKITDESGFQFQYQNGETEIRQMPVALGGGVALIDFDQDGLLDIFAVQGGSLPHDPDSRITGDRLFRNLGKMQFLDVTSELKLPAKSVGYGVGVAVGDVNNDSWPDLFITRFGSYALYLNRDGMGFTDETAAWGLGGSRDWPTSAAFADFDNDGDLDLYVCHYVVWDEKNPRICRHADTLKFMSCNPTTSAAQPDHLFRNDGGRFTDVSDMAGITAADKQGRGLGVIAADLDADGLTDIFVANDKSANFLFKNLGQMQFEEVAHLAGVAAGADGSYQAGMGVACGDYNGD
ncbi:MAG: FG-GAP-like repeat-containing protein, partial [Isosphaeraceae bacterium]